MNQIGRRIKSCREEQKMTQEELAGKVELSSHYLSAVERGVKVPKLETFIRIANALNVPSDILLTDVLNKGYEIKASIFSNQMKNLPIREKDRIFHVVEAMLEDATQDIR